MGIGPAQSAKPRPLDRRHRRQRGAVLAEFVIAIVPMLITFFTFLQLGWMFMAHLVFRYAGSDACRAAVVILKPLNPGDNGKDEEITTAAHVALGPWDRRFEDVKVKTTYDGDDPFGMVTTEMTASYKCGVPLGRSIVCKSDRKEMKVKVLMAHHGARYTEKKENSNSGGGL